MNRFHKISDDVNNFVKIFRAKRILTQSAALTYVTLLSFIPFSLFIIFLLPDVTGSSFDTKINDLLMDTFLPNQVDIITENFKGLFNRKMSLNVVNILMLLITSYSLFRVIIKSFDDILNVPERFQNGFFENLIKFLGTIVFGFLLMFIIYSASSMSILFSFLKWSFLAKINSLILPFLLMIIFISLIYFFLPTINLTKYNIFKSAFVTATIWLLTRIMFNWYVTYLTNLKVIYGVLASVPIFLLWIYLNWIVILSGVAFISIFEGRFIISEKTKTQKKLYRISFDVIPKEATLDNESFKISKSELKKTLKEIIDE